MSEQDKASTTETVAARETEMMAEVKATETAAAKEQEKKQVDSDIEFRPKPDPKMRVKGKVPPATGCSMTDWSRVLARREAAAGGAQTKELRRITKEEVMEHNSMDDLWMVIHGVVYDCTQWQLFHPGGKHILQAYAGLDVTEVNDYYHKWVNIEALLGPLAVGVLVKS